MGTFTLYVSLLFYVSIPMDFFEFILKE